MEHTFDFLARLGDIAMGVVALLLLLGVVFVILIEVLDFLIVDPLRKAAERSAEERTNESLKEDN